MPKATKHLSQTSATIVALGEVVEIITQYWDRSTAVPERLVAGEHIDEGDLRVRRWAMTDDDLVPPTFNRWFQSGDVLLHSRNIKKIARPDFRGITGEKLFIIRSKDESVLLQELLPFILQSATFQEYAESRWAGSTNKFLNKRPLEEFEFALPPIEEQRRLAIALHAADVAVEAYVAARARLLQCRESLSVATWGSESRGMETTALEHVCLRIQDGTHFSPKSMDGPYLYVTSKNVRDGFLDLTTVGRISRAEHEPIYKRCDVVYGDLLLTKDGANAGNVAINDIREPFSLLSSVAMIRPDASRVNVSYMFEFMRSSVGRAKLLAHVRGSAITRLTLEQIRAFSLPICDLKSQDKIVGAFSLIACGIAGLDLRVDGLRTLRQALLADLET